MFQSISDLKCGKVQLLLIIKVMMNVEKEGDVEGRKKIMGNRDTGRTVDAETGYLTDKKIES